MVLCVSDCNDPRSSFELVAAEVLDPTLGSKTSGSRKNSLFLLRHKQE